MKKIILSCGLVLLMLSAYANGDRLYHFYAQHDQATYYLSAPYGGGDELVTKKLINDPGENETFFLEVVRQGRTNSLSYRIKTFRNFYVKFTEDGQLMAEDKEPGMAHLFHMRTYAQSSETLNIGGNTVIKKTTTLSLGKQPGSGEMWYLSFNEEDEIFQMEKSVTSTLPQIHAHILDVTIHTSFNRPGMAQYTVKWVKAPGDRRPIAPAYLKVTIGRATPRDRTAIPVTQIWKVNSRFEPVLYSENLATVTLRTRNETDKAVKLESIQLWKSGKFHKSWKIDSKLEPGQRMVLFTNGSIKVY